MNRYSRSSRDRLDQAHPELILLFERVLPIMDHTIYCGHRNKADQNAAFAEGRSKLKWPHGKHNAIPSMAVDAGPYVPDVDRWDREQAIFFAGIVLGVADMLYESGEMTYRVRWGGDWDGDKNLHDQTFDDLVHFELV